MDGNNYQPRPASLFSSHARTPRQDVHMSKETEQLVLKSMASSLLSVTWSFGDLNPETANAIVRQASEKGIKVNFFDILHLSEILRDIAAEGPNNGHA